MAILAISREFGSGAKAIGEGVAGLLGYEYVDRQRMHSDIRSQGEIWDKYEKNFDEHYPNVWERNDWSFKGFVALTQAMIYAYASKDEVVITGAGAGFLLKGLPHVLRVRIEATMEDRIERVQGKDILSRDTARWLIEKVDGEMAKAMYVIYGKHWDNPGEYDAVVNTSHKGEAEIIAALGEAVKAKEAYNTEKTRQVVKMRALAAKIKAVILTDPSLFVSVLDVEPVEEDLPGFGFLLRGIVHKEEDVKRVEETARLLAGDAPVESHVHYQMYPRLGPLHFG
jgi:cytidylate kinase